MLCDSQNGFLEVLFIMLTSVQATAVQGNRVGCHHCTVSGTCTLTSEGVIVSADDCYAKCEQHADCLGIQYDNGTRDCNIFFSSVAGYCNGIVYNPGDVYVYRKSDRTDCSMLSLSHFWGMYTAIYVHKINPATKESCLEECFERDGCFDLTFLQMASDCFIYDDCTGCSEMSVPGFDSYRYLCIEGSPKTPPVATTSPGPATMISSSTVTISPPTLFPVILTSTETRTATPPVTKTIPGSLTSTSTGTGSSTTTLTISPGTLTITSSGKGTSLAPTPTAGRLITTTAATGITSATTETPGLLTSTVPVTGTPTAPTATLGLLTSTAPITGTPPAPTATFSTITAPGTGMTLAPTTTAGPLITTVPGTSMSPATTATPELLTSTAPGTVMTTAPTATPGLITSTAPGTRTPTAPTATPGLPTTTALGTGITPAPTVTPGLLTSTAPGTGITPALTATPVLLTSTATSIRTLTPAPTAVVGPQTSTAYGTGTSVSISALTGPLTSMQSVSILSSTSTTTAAVSEAPVLENNSTASTNKPVYIWPCLCSSNSFSGLSQDKIIEQLVNDVKIDRSNTLLSLSKKRCTDDSRVSAKSIGVIAAAMMATCGGIFILLDALGWMSGHVCK